MNSFVSPAFSGCYSTQTSRNLTPIVIYDFVFNLKTNFQYRVLEIVKMFCQNVNIEKLLTVKTVDKKSFSSFIKRQTEEIRGRVSC